MSCRVTFQLRVAVVSEAVCFSLDALHKFVETMRAALVKMLPRPDDFVETPR